MQSVFRPFLPRIFRATRTVRAPVVALAAFLPLAGCSDSGGGFSNPFAGIFGGGEKYETKVINDTPPDTIYDQGLARLQKKDFEGAGKKFGQLNKDYPNSQWSRKGLLMQVYSQYTESKYDDAIASANRYIGLYPNSPDTPYVYYMAGMSYYNQIPDADRDQDRAEKSVIIFSQLIQKFPTSEYSNDAKFKMQVAKDQIAAHEMKVGRYYMEQSNYTAAINRFHEVLAKYQSTRHTEEALYRLVEAYLRLGVPNEAQTAAAVLGHNFPESEWYQDAFNLLKKDGLEPQENKDSWISKAFHNVVG